MMSCCLLLTPDTTIQSFFSYYKVRADFNVDNEASAQNRPQQEIERLKQENAKLKQENLELKIRMKAQVDAHNTAYRMLCEVLREMLGL
jgi:hypothetical protein